MQSNVAPVTMTGIHKRFFGVHALRGACFEAAVGECHALVGANGAGKSTLAKILGGSLRADQGEVLLFGEPAVIRTPHEGISAGVGMVPQEPLLAPNMTVCSNIMLGREIERHGHLDHVAQREESTRLLRTVGLDVSPDALVADLDIAAQQLVQVARALGWSARILILDEPTSAITSHECRALFSLMARLQEQGVTIVYVSHRLPEVFALSDRITVLRDGRTVATLRTCRTDEDEVVAAMAGAARERLEPSEAVQAPAGQPGAPPLLEVRGLRREGEFENVDFSLWPGEILGLAGLVGSGRSEVARALAGLAPATDGRLLVEGAPVLMRTVAAARAAGIVMLPEDRKLQGLIPQLSVRQNLSLSVLERLCGFGGRVRPQAESALAERYRGLLSIRCSSVEQTISELSGGNQQKVLLGRALACEPKVLVLDEPTRGVDVGAKADIHRWVRSLAARGVGVILISSELEEVAALADRIVVMREGRSVCELAGPDTTEQDLVALAATAQAH